MRPTIDDEAIQRKKAHTMHVLFSGGIVGDAKNPNGQQFSKTLVQHESLDRLKN